MSTAKDEDRDEFFAGDTGIRETFINANIIHKSEEAWTDLEGCLSIPTLAGEVERPWTVTIEYMDQQFTSHTKTFRGATARMIQHEYDHTLGVLYIDYLSPLKRKLLAGKLAKIAKGQITAKYPMKFPVKPSLVYK